jgi:predicted cobalt transporter CbtA
MARTLLLRGMLAGVLAGIIAVGFAALFGEPPLELAIGFESAMDHAAGHAPEAELVSRAVQSSAGLLVAGVACGAALGGVVALVFAFAYQRVGRAGPKALAVLLAGAGFVTVTLVPQLKYPANPPSIGDAETIGLRTALHFEMVLIALAALTLAVLLGRHLRARLGGWNAVLVAALAFIAIVASVQLALPDVNEVPENFPAIVLWRFRIASFGTQLTLWASLGVIFAVLAERALSGRRGPARN